MKPMMAFFSLLSLLLMSSHLATGFEVFAFLLKTETSVWSKLPWQRITTVCLAGWLDPALVETAHKHGVKVAFIANFPKEQLLNSTFRKVWVQQQVEFAKVHHLDGVNFDFEDPLAPESAESKAYTRLLKDTVAQFHTTIPGSQVSVDVAWAPGGIDGRHYDYAALGRHADMLFVMGYDEQSQMWGSDDCIAKPNSPLRKTFHGVRQYLHLGIPPAKMILGVPWYGYRYPCLKLKSGVCYIEEVPFRGCNCTDAAGREFAYSKVVQWLALAEKGRKWDEESSTPMFEYREGSQDFQVWYDDPQSLAIKYQVAKLLGMRGAGFWTSNFLDYSNTAMVEEMWDAIPRINMS